VLVHSAAKHNKVLPLFETGVTMPHDWCSSSLHGVFQNAYFGVTQQIKGVETLFLQASNTML